MVNTKHDAHSYESTDNGESGYMREIFDGNVLYEAFLKSRKSCAWKPTVQQFEMNLLPELARLQRELQDRTYRFLPSTEFVLNERGKTRVISGEKFENRVVKHALCDEVLIPSVERFLIYDNGAGMKGKGTGFARDRLVKHLHQYYAKHKSNDGFIMLIDSSKYYDNIRHDTVLDMFGKYVADDLAMWLLEQIIENSKVDVSYMTDLEYSSCMDTLFDSVEYQKVDKSLLTGEKFMRKRLNIGDQTSQIAGISYQMRIDNYIKIVNGVKFYGRHADDSYTIHESKDFLQELLGGVTEIASGLGITINQRKTRICKLSEQWQYLQIRYSLTDTGRIIQKINPHKLAEKRRLLKKLSYILPETKFDEWYHSWFNSNYKIMSKKQRENMDELFYKLKEEMKCTQLDWPMA